MRQLLWACVCFFSLFLSGCVHHTVQEGQAAFADHHYEESFNALLPVAKSGNPNAQYAVGYMYFYGKGTKQDQKSGIYWIQKAAKQGQKDAIKALRVIDEASRRPAADPIESIT